MMAMKSPWAAGEKFSSPQGEARYVNGGVRGSLGQLIERSTSAPPSSEFHKHSSHYDDSLVGNDLLEHMSSTMSELDIGGAFNNRNYGAVKYEKDVLNGLEASNSSGRSTAPSTTSSSPFLPPGFASGEGDDGMYGKLYSSAALSSVPPEGLVRSQSAAPSYHSRSLAPPPGLNLASSQSDSFSMSIGRQRSSSAGLLGNNASALRPAAKTLMDLIQEDIPNERESSSFDDYEQERKSVSPGQVQRAYTPSYSPSPTSHQQHQMERPGSSYSRDGSFTPSSHMAGAPHQPMLHPQQHQPMAHVYNGLRVEDPHHQMPHSPEAMYAHVQTHIPQQQSPIENVYFGSPAAQQQRVQQVIHTPNGQALYVNGASPSPAYGYATIQYQQRQPQQPQIIHQTVGGEQQFMSIVPIQGATHQVAYWQQDGGVGAPVTIMKPGGPNGQLSLGRVGGHHVPQQVEQLHGNYGGGGGARREKGGRGRRSGGGGGGGGGSRRGGPDSKHPQGSTCSPLLEEFRAMKNRDWTIHQISGHIVEFCQDQNGSRFIQQRLEMGDPGEQQVVVREVLPAIRRLRNDVFGNYVVQKLLDFGSPQVKADIRDTLEGEMLQLSLQMYGCRVVQKALETISEDDLPRLLVEFHHNVLSCIHDQNGNHVMQKCIEVVSKRAKKASSMGDEARAASLNGQIDFIIRDVLVNTASLSCHPYGCRVLQRMLEHCEEQRKNDVLDKIMACHRKLLDDQYGNYVIQHVLQYGRTIDRDSILQIIAESGLLCLSRQKFASNVVEKLLKYGNSPQRRTIVREMLKIADDPGSLAPALNGERPTVVLLMVRDAYANYVVQTTLDVVPESEEKRLLLEELSAHADELKQYTFAKHIVAKLGTMVQI